MWKVEVKPSECKERPHGGVQWQAREGATNVLSSIPTTRSGEGADKSKRRHGEVRGVQHIVDEGVVNGTSTVRLKLVPNAAQGVHTEGVERRREGAVPWERPQGLALAKASEKCSGDGGSIAPRAAIVGCVVYTAWQPAVKVAREAVLCAVDDVGRKGSWSVETRGDVAEVVRYTRWLR